MEIDGVEKQTKQSDRSSNDSDLKVEIRTASSLSNIPEHDSEHWDEGSDAMKNESIYRYSDYIDPVFPPKHVSNAATLHFIKLQEYKARCKKFTIKSSFYRMAIITTGMYHMSIILVTTTLLSPETQFITVKVE